VSDEEDEQKEAPVADLLLAVLDHEVDDVERQPADDEDGDHGDQHAVGAATAADLLLLTTARRRRRAGRLAAAGRQAPLGASSTSKRHGHAPVTDDDDGARHQVLQYEATAQFILILLLQDIVLTR